MTIKKYKKYYKEKECIICGNKYLGKNTSILCSLQCNGIKQKNKIISDETKHKMSISQKKRFKETPNPRLGKKSSKETREKLRISHLGQTAWNKGIKWLEKMGENHPRWKGGYENKLYLNRKRRVLKLKADGSHTLDQWQELKKKYDYMCLCCKQKEPFITLSEDHVIPLSKGGTDDILNIQPLCHSCNSRKNDKIINFLFEKIEKGILTS